MPNGRKRGFRALAVLCSVLLGAALLGACSDDDDDDGAVAGDSSTTTEAGGTGDVRGVTDTEITVGGLVTKSSFPSVDTVAQARFAEAERNGEIPGGRKIRYLPAADDTGTPNGALAAAQRLVQQSQVFAIAPTISVHLEAGGSDYINQQKVPLVGWGLQPGHCSGDKGSYHLAFSGCLVPKPPANPYAGYTVDATRALLKELGNTEAKPSIALICEDYATSRQACDTSSTAYELGGWNVTYKKASLPLPVASDYSPFVQELLSSDDGGPPDVITQLIGVQNALGISKALKQANYKGVISNIFYAPQLTAANAGVYTTSGWAVPESDAPAMKKIVATLKGAGVENIGIGELASYFGADMFVKILQKVGPNLTPERFQKVASEFTYEIPGVVGPTHYPEGFTIGPSCTGYSHSDGTKWEVVVPFKCYPFSMKRDGDKATKVKYPDDIE